MSSHTSPSVIFLHLSTNFPPDHPIRGRASTSEQNQKLAGQLQDQTVGVSSPQQLTTHKKRLTQLKPWDKFIKLLGPELNTVNFYLQSESTQLEFQPRVIWNLFDSKTCFPEILGLTGKNKFTIFLGRGGKTSTQGYVTLFLVNLIFKHRYTL